MTTTTDRPTDEPTRLSSRYATPPAYYAHGDDGQTARILNVLFDAFGYNEARYRLSKAFTSPEADEALEAAGLNVDFFKWWMANARWYIYQGAPRGGWSTYYFADEAFTNGGEDR